VIARSLFLAILLSAQAAMADTSIETEKLRLDFDSTGQLRSAFACFPACTGDNARVQQFGDDGVIVFPRQGSAWQKSSSRTETHYLLSFSDGRGASMSWKIPLQGYLLELEAAGVGGLELRSGESFRPREAAGFGTWLEQARYALIRSVLDPDGETAASCRADAANGRG
jgi:hypothetical protein